MKEPNASLGYFELGVAITPSHIILEITYYLLTLTEIINYNFYISINIVLPSKVRAKITPTQPPDNITTRMMDAGVGRRWNV
jgi:hypothetical protein